MADVRITGPLNTKYTGDQYPTHYEQYGVGGYRFVENYTQLTSIETYKRRRLMLVGIANYGGSPALFWLLSPDNTASNLANNAYWTQVNIGQSLDAGVIFKGFVDWTSGLITGGSYDGQTMTDVPLIPAATEPGWFWIVNTTGSYDPGSGSFSANANDWIIYDGSQFRLNEQSSVTWSSLTGVPQILRDIGDGTIIVATYGDITNLQDQIDALEIPVLEAEVSASVPQANGATVAAILSYAYSKDEIQAIIALLEAGAGSGADVKKYTWNASADDEKIYEIPAALTGEIASILVVFVEGALQEEAGVVYATVNIDGKGITLDVDDGEIFQDDTIVLIYKSNVVDPGLTATQVVQLYQSDQTHATKIAPIKLQSSTLLSLTGSNSIELLSAPGAGMSIAVERVWFKKNASGGYNDNGFIKFDGATDPIEIIPLIDTEDKYDSVTVGDIPFDTNKALVFSSFQAISGGTNDLEMLILYRILTFGNYTEI